MINFDNSEKSPTGSLLSAEGINPSGSIELPEQTTESLESVKPEVPTGVQAQTVPTPREPESMASVPFAPPVVPEGETEVTEEDPIVQDPQRDRERLAKAMTFEEPKETKEVDPWEGKRVKFAGEPEIIPGSEDLVDTKVDGRQEPEILTNWDGVRVKPFKKKNIDEQAVDDHVGGVIDTMNRVAYKGVKGIADAADFLTSPGWALGSLVGGQKFPFATMLEQNYPEKNYVIAEDADSYYDDMLRITATGLEFTTGGLLTGGGIAQGSRALGSKAAQLAPKAEISSGMLSGMGYQSVLDYTDNEMAAFAAAILSPSASKPMELMFRGSVGALKVGAKPITWPLGKIYNFSPVFQMANPKAHITALKVQLASKEEMWTTGYGKLARKLVEKMPEDTRVTIDQQIEQLSNLQSWLNRAIPKNERIFKHRDSMMEMQEQLNTWSQKKGLGEFKLTLDQMFKPLLKEMKDTEGLEELLEVGKLINPDAYAAQLRNNENILKTFLNDESVPISVKQSEYFQGVFKDKADELGELGDAIASKVISEGLFTSKSAYDYPADAMPKVIKGLNDVRDLHIEAYGQWQKTIPDIDLDVTPIKNAFEELALSTGLFDDPKNTPAYLRTMVDDLNSLGKGKSKRVAQLDATDDIDIQLKELAKQRRQLQLDHAKELETADVKADLEVKHREELQVLDDLRTDLNTEKLELSKAKRAEVSKAEQGVINIPDPSFTDVKDVIKAHKILSDIKFASLKVGDDKYTTIKPILDSVDETLEGLMEVDKDVYNSWRAMQDNYRKFVGIEMKDSVVRKAVGPDGRTYNISSGRAVDAFFKNAKADEIGDLLRVFDSKKGGLNKWLEVIAEEAEETPDKLRQVIRKSGADIFADVSDEAVTAYKDVVYTSLAKEVTDKIEGTVTMDPAKRLEAIDDVVLSWMQKNRDKLDVIPDLELTPENITNARAKLGRYIEQTKVIEEQRKLAMFTQLQGPGMTIQNAMRNDVKANQLADFLEDALPELAYGDKGPLGPAVSTNIRQLMYNSLVRDNMDGNVFDYKGMSKLLTEGSTTRNNLLKILGDNSVAKLDAKVALHRAITENEVPLTEALNSDKAITAMNKLGLSFGRLGSILQRRAVFQPSGGYLAGAAMSKLIDVAGKRETSKAIQVFMDNPSSLLEFDNILLNAKNKLSQQKKVRMDGYLREGNIKGLYPMLKDLYVGEAKGYFGYLGIQLPDEDIEEAIREVFFFGESEAEPEVTEVTPEQEVTEEETP